MANESVSELIQAIKTWFYRRQACRRVLKTAPNPGGLPIDAFDKIRAGACRVSNDAALVTAL